MRPANDLSRSSVLCRLNSAPPACGLSLNSAPPARGQNRPCRLIGPEIFDAVDRKQFGEPRARTVDPALDGADRALADPRRLLVGEALRSDENERLALVVWG